MRYHATAPKDFLDKAAIFVEPEELQRLCARYAPAGEYTVTTENNEGHEWGQGGFREYRTRLLKGDQLLILSVHYSSWDTSSDDSTDYSRGENRLMFLLKDAPVAQQIFNAISSESLATKKKEG